MLTTVVGHQQHFATCLFPAPLDELMQCFMEISTPYTTSDVYRLIWPRVSIERRSRSIVECIFHPINCFTSSSSKHSSPFIESLLSQRTPLSGQWNSCLLSAYHCLDSHQSSRHAFVHFILEMLIQQVFQHKQSSVSLTDCNFQLPFRQKTSFGRTA